VPGGGFEAPGLDTAQGKARSEFGPAWPVVLGCMACVATGASPVPYNSIGFFLPELNREFGWGFAEISLGITIFGVLGALLAPVYGGLADRHGAKRVGLASLAAFGILFASFALVQSSIWHFYLLWVLIGFVGIGSTPVTFSRLVNIWFFRNRGLALGIMLVGTSVAAVVIPPLVTWAIAEFGWRQAHLVVAALPLFVGLPLGLLLLREPRPGERPETGAAGLQAGVTLSQALSDRRFWLMWVSIFLVAFAYGGAHIHMPEIVKMNGFGQAEAARAMQVLGLSILAGRLLTGLLLDRFWAPAVCFPILCLPAISVLILLGEGPEFAMILVAAFLLGFAAGAESDLIAYLGSRYFGLAHYGKIYGFLYMAFAMASAFSPAVYGAVRDATGSYDGMLAAAAGLFVAGALLLLFLGRYPELRAAEAESGAAAAAVA
jgi:MFS family permease